MHISGTGNNYLRLITIASFIIGTGLYVNPLTDIFSIHHSTDLVLIMTQLPKKINLMGMQRHVCCYKESHGVVSLDTVPL